MTLVTQPLASDGSPVPIELIPDAQFAEWLANQTPDVQHWLGTTGIRGKAGDLTWLPDQNGRAASVLAVSNPADPLAALGALPRKLPAGIYALTEPSDDLVLLGWAMGAYRFTRYKEAAEAPPRLLHTDADQVERVNRINGGVTLARDLINTPAEDMLPSNLASASRDVAEAFEAELVVTSGDALLDAGYRTIHAVGRASTDEPRLIDLSWGDPSDPQIVLVGKGICFDSGGLDIKPASGMRTMKKDMGGAAQALGLAQLIMAAGLPIRLRLLIAAAENAIAGNAYRPGDIIRTYSGRTVEIDNTDAEGRLVMCDALALAAEDNPDLIVDFSTLTGSARSAVGAEVSAMFSNNDEAAAALTRHGNATDDPVWRLPLHQPYRHMLESKVADCVNSAATPYAGAITAALFLEPFVGACAWVHFDLMAYNLRERPARPEGGEAMALRAVFSYLEERYGERS